MVEEDGVEPPFFPNFTMQLSCELIRAFNPITHSVRPAFQLSPSCRDTLPGSLLILILSTLRKLTHGKHKVFFAQNTYLCTKIHVSLKIYIAYDNK